jgi:hypothetical protein
MAGIPHDLIGEGTRWLNRFHAAGEQIRTRLVLTPPPILAQSLEQLRRERQIAVARALSLMHMDQHERRIDVANLQVDGFGSPQSGRIKQHQHCAVPHIQSSFDEPDDLLLAQDNWQLLGRSYQGQVLDIDVAPSQGLLVQEPQCAHAERNCAERQLLLADHVQLKLAYFVGAHQFGRLAEVLGQVFNGMNVATNRVWCVVPALKLVQHPLT